MALKTHHNNYISAVSGGAGEPINQAPHLYSYEKFTPISKNDDTDTLDFSSTSTQSITINLSSYYVQTVNRNLKLRLGSALGIDIKNVVGGTKNDRLTGNKLNNNLSGGNGDDYIDGRAGSDSMYGGTDNDYYYVDSTGDRVVEYSNQGTDRVYSYISGYTLTANVENLSLLGTIEKVELTGGASNNILDASLATVEVRLEGKDGNDILKGGSGDDTLIGGKGTNHLWGGEGADSFVIDKNGLQRIKDFERGVDKIDMAGSKWNPISFAFDPTTKNTTIKVNNIDRVIVEGVMVDSTSLINTDRDITPKAINNINNIYTVLQGWAESYAESNGLNSTNVKLINDGTINLTPGTMEFVNLGTLQASPITRQAEILFRSVRANDSAPNTTVFRYSDGTAYENSTQDTTSWSFDNTVGASVSVGVSHTVSAEIGVPFGNVSGSTTLSLEVGANYSKTWSQGGSSTQIDKSKVNQQTTTEFRITSVPGAVTKAIATGVGGQYSGSQYEMPVYITGTVGIDLNGNGAIDPNTKEIVDLPVNAILQYYNPDTFVGQGLERTHSLPTGQILLYNETTEAKITGKTNGAFFLYLLKDDR